jgi:sugar phosphate isomerase/epimerase
MKISCLPVSTFDDFATGRRDLVGWARQGRTLGLDGIDISAHMVEGFTETRAARVGKKIEECQMQVAMYAIYSQFTADENNFTIKCYKYIEREFAIASALHASLIRITIGPDYPGISRENFLKRIEKELYRVKELSNEYDIGEDE